MIGVFPAPDSVGVSPEVGLEVRFSEPVDSATEDAAASDEDTSGEDDKGGILEQAAQAVSDFVEDVVEEIKDIFDGDD